MKKSLSLNFCDISIHDNYMVVIMKHGTNLIAKHNEILKKISNTYYLNKPFVYISHRINSYSVDPKIYLETSKIENLKGFAVASKKYHAKINAQIEKMFFSKEYEIFDKLEDAVQWAKKLTTP